MTKRRMILLAGTLAIAGAGGISAWNWWDAYRSRITDAGLFVARICEDQARRAFPDGGEGRRLERESCLRDWQPELARMEAHLLRHDTLAGLKRGP